MPRAHRSRSSGGLAGLVLLATALVGASAEAGSLRFYGHGGSAGENFVFPDRVKISSVPSAAVNVGAGDFTIEFWMRADASENTNPFQSCGYGNRWVESNIVIDRDRYNQGRSVGIGLLGGFVAWGASNDVNDGDISYTLCGTTNVLDLQWHHVAVERRESDGRMRVWIDGALDAEGPLSGGPFGDVSYPVGAVPGNYCDPNGGAGSSSCTNSDPYLVFGAEKHGFSGINYSGWLDEVRLSNTLRYATPFTPFASPLVADGDTAALYHFDEGLGTLLGDASGQGGDGTIFFGGLPPAGPLWSGESPFPPELPVLPAPWLLPLVLAATGVPLCRRGSAAPEASRQDL